MDDKRSKRVKCDLSVVAPCYNEAGNLPELVDRLQRVFTKRGLRGQIVLVNDGSRDNTGAVIESLCQQHSNVVAVHHPTNRGIEAGWRSGVSAAAGRYVCLIDADLQNLPEDVWRLYREIPLRNTDVVQGYRSSVGRLKDSRLGLSKGLNSLLNALFGMRLRDNKSGFVLAMKDTMENILRHRFRYRYFQTFIMVSAAAKGYTIAEVETMFESRLVGKSFIPRLPLSVIAGVLTDFPKAFYEFRLRTKKENILEEVLKENRPTHADPPLTGWRRLLFEAFFLTMPLHKWMITRRARLYYKELKESQWLSAEKVRELQERKLRRLVHHGYYHVPHYRQKFDELGLEPSDIQTLEDLRKLPLLSKQDVRDHLYFDMLSDNHDKRRMLKVATSGSTGEPFVCYADQHQLEIRWAATLRSLEWTGYRFGDRQARLWHQTLGMTWLQATRERIDAWFNRRLFIPAFEMSDENITQFVTKLKRFRPVLIDGYAESFNFLAHYIKTHSLEGLHPKAIMSSAQVLPTQSREIIQKAFDCGVFDKYGSREFSGIAYECDAHQGHHVVAESYIVEILRDGQPAAPGELGEVVVTDLNNFCLPFIRYRVGDLAAAVDPSQPCPCGRGLPRIGCIEGRVQAIIVGANGRYLPGTFFAHFFKDYEHLLRQYQVVQSEVGRVTLKIIKGPRFTEEGFRELLGQLRLYWGEQTVVDLEIVDHIPMVHTGKHQGSISRLPFEVLSRGIGNK